MSKNELVILKDFIKRFYKSILFYIGAQGIGRYISILIVSIIGASTDAIISGDFTYLKENTLTICIVLLIATFIVPLITLLSYRLYVSLGVDFDEISYKKLLKQKKKMLEKHELGEFLYRMLDDAIGYRGGLLTLIGDGVIVLYVILQSFYVLYKINLTLALLALILNSVPILVIKLLDKKLSGYYEKEKICRSEVYSKERNIIENFQFIKTHSINDKVILGLKTEYSKYLGNFKGLTKVTNILELFKEIFSIGSEIVIYIIGSYFIAKGSITIGNAIEFFAISIILKENTLLLTKVIDNYYGFRISSKRYMEWTTCDEENGKAKINSLYPIKLNNLKYSYDNKSYALNGLSFSINEGDHLVLRGSNGCGKSTLINILTGIYDDYEGDITLNNIPLNEVDKGELRSEISYLEQNPFLLNDTVYNNIKYFSDGSEDEILKVLKSFDILDLKDKIVGEGGGMLSGGQRQKVAIARAILSKKSLIILDEPDNTLDIESKNKVIEYFSRSNKTVLTISHNEEWLNSHNKVLKCF